MVIVAGRGAPRTWVVGPVGEDLERVEVHHPNPAALVKTLTIQATGLANTAPLQISNRLLFARCVINVDSQHLMSGYDKPRPLDCQSSDFSIVKTEPAIL